MSLPLDWVTIKTIAGRTFRQSIESPVAYVLAIFFYGFIGVLFGLSFFSNGQASVAPIGFMAPWILWFVVPALTMGLIADEIRTGTFEPLSTLPVRDWEIVLGKYLGYAALAVLLIGGLIFYPIVVSFVTDHPKGMDWGNNIGTLGGLILLSLFYGAIGLWTSSLAKNQVVVLILGMLVCTVFFFLGQLYSLFPGPLARVADYLGISSHLGVITRGVWDIRDIFYFVSMTFLFLYLTVQRLSTRRF